MSGAYSGAARRIHSVHVAQNTDRAASTRGATGAARLAAVVAVAAEALLVDEQAAVRAEYGVGHRADMPTDATSGALGARSPARPQRIRRIV